MMQDTDERQIAIAGGTENPKIIYGGPPQVKIPLFLTAMSRVDKEKKDKK